MATLQEKIARVHAADKAYRDAMADLGSPETGDSLKPGTEVFDKGSGQIFANANGKISRRKIDTVEAP